MKKTVLEVVRINNADVVATSSQGHYSIANMSKNAYELQVDVGFDETFSVCGTYLVGASPVTYGSSFSFYDENGTVTDTDLMTNGWVETDSIGVKDSGKFFHYKDNSGTITYVECNDSHHWVN